MKTEIVNPVLGNFISSLRDIGYTFEIAVADVLDNSVAAGAKNVAIHAVSEPEIMFCMLDDGDGMSGDELVEAMRLATRNPDDPRSKSDLGRFGLGLKTASFSQCRKLTVVSKKDRKLTARQWDLDLIAAKNKWLLITPELKSLANYPLFDRLDEQKHGTLVIWESLDRYKKSTFVYEIDKLRKHVSLVFHRFLEATGRNQKIKIFVNNSEIKPFNPFNSKHRATQELPTEILKVFNSQIHVRPFILPHHSRLSQQEYEQYATEDGYTKSQGFYLYRANRLLIYGTWWGLHRAVDAHKLVRIMIDVSNDQDRLWGIDIKKSTAAPVSEIRTDLTRIIKQVTDRGSKTYSVRGKKISDKATTRFWELVASHEQIRFALNTDHPMYTSLLDVQSDPELFKAYLKGIQAFLPLDAIQAQLQQNPHQLDQESHFSETELDELANKLRSSTLDPAYIEQLLKTELFKTRQELLKQ